MNKVAKAASGITAAGGLGGVAYGTYDYKTATAEYLVGLTEGPDVFVKENDKEQLKALINSYKDSATRNGIEISGLNLGDDDSKNQKALFEKCQELKNTSIRFKSDEAYRKLWTQVSHWCTVIRNIEDTLLREWRAILSEIQNVKDDFDTEFDIHKNELEFKTFLGKVDQDSLEKSENLTVYKSSCKATLAKKVSDSDYYSNLESARKYCAKKITV